MRNLCLDIGNVLVKIDFTKFENNLSSRLNIPIAECWDFLNRVQKLHDLGITNLSDELKDHFKIKSEYIVNELLDSWNEVLVPNYKVIESLDSFAVRNNIEIALVSNIGFEHAAWFDSRIKFTNAKKHFSCHVGARKPNLIYYQSLLQRYPQFNGAIYVDDNLENLKTGKEMGLIPVNFDLSINDGDNVDIYLIRDICKEMEIYNE